MAHGSCGPARSCVHQGRDLEWPTPMDAAVPPRFKPTEPDRRWQGEHEWLDRRSLAMHRWMAEILRDHPHWLHERVRPTLLRWMQQVDPRNKFRTPTPI